MEVNGPSSVPGNFRIDSVSRPTQFERSSEAQSTTPKDELEISSAGKMLQSMSESGELRSERLAKIKADIEAGVYETPEKLEMALERLLGEIGQSDDD